MSVAIAMAATEIVTAVQKALDEDHNKKRNFTQTVDLAINLKDIDMNEPSNRVDEEIHLPSGRGEDAKVGVFGSGEMALKAKEVADGVFEPDKIEDIADDVAQAKQIAETYDFFIAAAPLMPSIGKHLGRFLGPRGKMPTPVPPTADIADEVERLRHTARVRSRSATTFHCRVGMETMDPEDIADNIDAILKILEEKLERGRNNIDAIYVKTTMGKPVEVA